MRGESLKFSPREIVTSKRDKARRDKALRHKGWGTKVQRHQGAQE